MAIPTGPFPAPIDYADLRVGMHVRASFVYLDTGETLVAEVWISKVEAGQAYASTAGLMVADPLTWDDPTRDETLELLETFTGNPNEPNVGTAVLGADGSVYRRAQNTIDPTASTWYATGSTTAVTWSTITASGLSTVILNGE